VPSLTQFLVGGDNPCGRRLYPICLEVVLVIAVQQCQRVQRGDERWSHQTYGPSQGEWPSRQLSLATNLCQSLVCSTKMLQSIQIICRSRWGLSMSGMMKRSAICTCGGSRYVEFMLSINGRLSLTQLTDSLLALLLISLIGSSAPSE
jgi:hypothetical protein